MGEVSAHASGETSRESQLQYSLLSTDIGPDGRLLE